MLYVVNDNSTSSSLEEVDEDEEEDEEDDVSESDNGSSDKSSFGERVLAIPSSELLSPWECLFVMMEKSVFFSFLKVKL
jgi:hypothetical protein